MGLPNISVPKGLFQVINLFIYYIVIYMQSGRAGEAEQAYKFALKAKLSDTALLEEIKELHTANANLSTFSEASNIEIV